MFTIQRTYLCMYCFVLLLRCSSVQTDDTSEEQCTPNENDRAAKGYAVVATMLDGGSNNIPILSQLASIFSGSAQIMDMDDSVRACLRQKFDKVNDDLQRIARGLRSFEKNNELARIMQETRTILRNIRGVDIHVKDLKLFRNEKVAQRAAKRACERKSPLETLKMIHHQAINSAKMFDTIAEGTRFALPLFNNITSMIMTEVGMCALLAIECNQILLVGQASQAFIDHKFADISTTLNALIEALNESRSQLEQKFSVAVPDAIQAALEESGNRNLIGQEKADFIYEYLKTIYPFRSWAVIMYDYIRQNAKNIHAQDGSPFSTWFFESDSDHTVVVHGADGAKDGCESFSNFMHGKRLRSLFINRQSFESFATMDGNLGQSISVLKETLQRKERIFPETIFFAVVLFRNQLVVARDPGDKYNYFENVRVSGSLTKSVFMAWC